MTGVRALRERNPCVGRVVVWLTQATLFLCLSPPAWAEEQSQGVELPDAPEPQVEMCPHTSFRAGTGEAWIGAEPEVSSSVPVDRIRMSDNPHPFVLGTTKHCNPNQSREKNAPCTAPAEDLLKPILNDWTARPLTPGMKFRLAVNNVKDPFNMLSLGFSAGFSTVTSPHSAYGPGFDGFSRHLGVAATQDIQGEFISTFLIPTLVHQDPHYHRMPDASVKRRVLHVFAQSLWTQSDYGTGMLNYSNIVGTAVNGTLSNVYVPGRRQGFGPTAERYVTAMATGPIGNVINEFLPDVASHVHIQVFLVQWIVNQVARENGTSPTP